MEVAEHRQVGGALKRTLWPVCKHGLWFRWPLGYAEQRLPAGAAQWSVAPCRALDTSGLTWDCFLGQTLKCLAALFVQSNKALCLRETLTVCTLFQAGH